MAVPFMRRMQGVVVDVLAGGLEGERVGLAGLQHRRHEDAVVGSDLVGPVVLFVQVTVSPALMVTLAGANAPGVIFTVTVAAAELVAGIASTSAAKTT